MQRDKFEIIYVRLLEGTETFVPINAKHIDENLYEIVHNKYLQLEDDATSIWEFLPGDVVRCIKKKDVFSPLKESNNTILLATELISSTFPNRKLYKLIYMIVENLGNIEFSELKGFENEIKQLYDNKDIFQRNHPIVKKWIEKHKNNW